MSHLFTKMATRKHSMECKLQTSNKANYTMCYH